jgi:hypothetical protein
MSIKRSKLLGDSSLGVIFELGSLGNATGVIDRAADVMSISTKCKQACVAIMHDGCCLSGCLPRVAHPGPPPRRCTTLSKTSIPLNPLTQCPLQKCLQHPSQKQSSSRTSRPYPRGPPPDPAARRLSTSWLLLAKESTIERLCSAKSRLWSKATFPIYPGFWISASSLAKAIGQFGSSGIGLRRCAPWPPDPQPGAIVGGRTRPGRQPD